MKRGCDVMNCLWCQGKVTNYIHNIGGCKYIGHVKIFMTLIEKRKGLLDSIIILTDVGLHECVVKFFNDEIKPIR